MAVKILFDTVIVDMYHYSFAKTWRSTTQRVNPNVNCELQLIIMHQYLLNCNKCATLIKMIGIRETGWGQKRHAVTLCSVCPVSSLPYRSRKSC